MKATQVLSDEHQVILRVIAALETNTKKLEGGQTIRPEFFLEASAFIKGFADGCHHMKEEGVLFKAMVASGMPQDSGPIAVMLAEHEQGRVFNRQMKAGAERLQYGDDPQARRAVIQNALGYCQLLSQHIQKEDNILFPMADRVIPAEEHEQVWQDFERIEHEETGEGVHEKYLALAEKLEQDANG
jgi:hemerythrin-like domain-containing protein